MSLCKAVFIVSCEYTNILTLFLCVSVCVCLCVCVRVCVCASE